MSIRPNIEVIRQPEGFIFVLGDQKTMCVLVEDGTSFDQNLLRSRFESHSAELKGFARQKLDDGCPTAADLVIVTLSELLGFSS